MILQFLIPESRIKVIKGLETDGRSPVKGNPCKLDNLLCRELFYSTVRLFSLGAPETAFPHGR